MCMGIENVTHSTITFKSREITQPVLFSVLTFSHETASSGVGHIEESVHFYIGLCFSHRKMFFRSIEYFVIA